MKFAKKNISLDSTLNMNLLRVSNNYDQTEKKKKSSIISFDSLNEMSRREELEP